jgi:GTP-binding protein HflX
LSDTVGFIHKLPHQLVEAFKSTLEEVVSADLLLHVVDAANPAYEMQAAVVARVLDEIGAAERPTLLIFNKIDELDHAARRAIELAAARADAVAVSAKTGTGIDGLKAAVDKRLAADRERVQFRVPFHRGEVLARLYRDGAVIDARQDGSATLITALVTAKLAGQVRKSLAPKT